MTSSAVRLGIALPHRGREPVTAGQLVAAARRAEELGFRDLWVTENVLDPHFCLDPLIALGMAAAVTQKIGLGVAVMVLPTHQPIHLAHRVATLDHLSGGRVVLGVGLGRQQHLQQFGIDPTSRVRRMVEGIHVMRTLWQEEQPSYTGRIFPLDGDHLSAKPAGRTIPIWMGGGAPAALDRAARLADGWVGSGGGEAIGGFADRVRHLRAALALHGRDPATYPISKRVFVSVDRRPTRARAEVASWFGDFYGSAAKADDHALHGTPGQVREQLDDLVRAGATHLILNPVSEHPAQMEALAELVGLS